MPPRSADGAVSRGAFTGVIRWVGGALAVMWAVMSFLPKHATSRSS
ncbi:hypothetical protein SCATT_57380 [Streptantibioticus cattleyicolor NRRL 8057 = DSM 46488]|uniref:Uncharacterized protein n=1 Tax=Streptantibioticus cattleyicolor (strain ATCC 35852 / DSM 46488 / JCM 4925 / NBRC 14057 / NRRL 8057) TaxID=1003195 RepID=G8WYH9_STREN|nr:hypothetical protein SCATT_57380 [Streptantibioticus cattleyicolor NRRL 8057 = DSM 46488]